MRLIHPRHETFLTDGAFVLAWNPVLNEKVYFDCACASSAKLRQIDRSLSKVKVSAILFSSLLLSEGYSSALASSIASEFVERESVSMAASGRSIASEFVERKSVSMAAV
jgi:hypothetical protein